MKKLSWRFWHVFNIKTKATYAILLATMLWGMTFAFIKDAVSQLSPFNFLFLRFGIAAFLLLLIFPKKIHFSYRELQKKGLILGFFLAGTVIFQTIGLRYTNASTASFITGLSVIMVTIFSCLFEKKWPNKFVILSSLLALMGISLITLSQGLVINQGDIWVFLCAISFAFYIIFAGKFSQSDGALTLTFFQLITIFFITLSISAIESTLTFPKNFNVWVAILFCSIFASIIAFLLQLRFQQYVSASKTAIIFATEPIFATITAVLYLNEKLSTPFVIGAVLIFFAILLSEKKIKIKSIPQD